jgi:hypothetical protein
MAASFADCEFIGIDHLFSNLLAWASSSGFSLPMRTPSVQVPFQPVAVITPVDIGHDFAWYVVSHGHNTFHGNPGLYNDSLLEPKASRLPFLQRHLDHFVAWSGRAIVTPMSQNACTG